MATHKFPVGGLTEFPEFWIVRETIASEQCPHCVPNPNFNEKYQQWICPRAIVTWVEGGYDRVEVCLDCILEAAKTLEGKE